VQRSNHGAIGWSLWQVHVYLLELLQEAISSFIISTETGLLTSASVVDVPYVKVGLWREAAIQSYKAGGVPKS
jgi:hypothetical protein